MSTFPTDDPENLAGLGTYRTILLAILRIIGTEPLAWTAAGMLQGNSARGRLLLCAGINSAAVAQLANRLKSNPELLDDVAWVKRQSRLATLRYLLYPAIGARRSYWRRPSNDAAFFIHTWTPIALQGAGRGPKAALIAGSVVGPLTNIAAAILNGEWRRPPPEVKQGVLAYSIGTVIAGVFTANIVTTLRSARADALAEEQLRHDVARARAEKAKAQIAFDSWKRSLADLQEAVVRQLQPADALQVLRELDAELTSDADTSVTPRGTVEEVIERAAKDYVVPVQLDITGLTKCQLPCLQAVYLVTHSALGNIVHHSDAHFARISYTVLSDSSTLIIENSGLGVIVERDEFNEHHALGRTQAYLRGLDGSLKIGPGPQGGTVVTATWRNR